MGRHGLDPAAASRRWDVCSPFPWFQLRVDSMQEVVHGEIVQSLEKRHEELIVQLDALNGRLEQVLSGLAKPTNPEETQDEG